MKNFFTFCLLVLTAGMPCLCMGANKDLPKGKEIGFLNEKTDKFRKIADHIAMTRSSDNMITNPEGNRTLYARSSSWYALDWWGISQGTDSGLVVELVEGDNNTVYLNNPISQWDCGTYFEGTRKNETLTFHFPQLVYQEYDEIGDLFNFYLLPIKYDYEIEDFILVEDQNLVLIDSGDKILPQDPDVILALCLETEGVFVWSGFGDWNLDYAIHKDLPLVIPTGLSTERYGMIDYNTGHYVYVAFDGDDVYFQGIYAGVPEGWIKAKFENSMAIIPTNQYLGIDLAERHFAYLCTAEMELEWDYEWDEEIEVDVPTEELIMVYDKDEKKFSSLTGSFYIFTGPDKSLNDDFLEIIMYPEIYYMERDPYAPPMNPVIAYYAPREDDDFGLLMFEIPALDINNVILDKNHLYYRLFVDEDVYEFDPEDYPGLDEPTTLMPYNFTDNDAIRLSFGLFFLKTYFLFEERVGLQSVYEEEGRLIYSQIVWDDDTVEDYPNDNPDDASVEILNSDYKVIYYDINGRIINNPQKGIYIKQVIKPNGDSVVSKIVLH